MKRQWIVIFFAFLVAIYVDSSRNQWLMSIPLRLDNQQLTRMPSRFEYPQQTAVTLSIAPDTTISRESITVRFTNNSDIEHGYGLPFILEAKVGSFWTKVDFLNGNFVLPMFIIPPYSYVDLNKDLQQLFGDLPRGEYRIIHDVFYDPIPGGGYSSFQVMVEFTLPGHGYNNIMFILCGLIFALLLFKVVGILKKMYRRKGMNDGT